MNKKITIQDLVNLVAKKDGISRVDAEVFVRGLFELIAEALAADSYVKVKGLGTFKLTEVESRESVNIHTGERMEIQGHVKITFTPDSSMKEQINKPFAHFETVILNEGTRTEDMEAFAPDVEEQQPIRIEDITVEEEAPILAAETGSPVKPGDIIPEEQPVSDIEEPGSVMVEKPSLPEAEVAETPKEEVMVVSEEKETVATPEVEEAEATSEAEVVTHVEEEIPVASEGAPVTTSEEETVAVVEEEETVEPSEEEVVDEEEIMPERRKTPWCIILAVILALCLAGGVYWYMQSAPEEPQVPEAVVEAPQVEAVVEPQDSLVSESAPQDTIAPKPVLPVPVSPEKRDISKVTLADTLDYRITGTKASHTLQSGETLIRLALRFYGEKGLWPYIVQHNRDVIKDADRVPVGTALRIPELSPRNPDV